MIGLGVGEGTGDVGAEIGDTFFPLGDGLGEIAAITVFKLFFVAADTGAGDIHFIGADPDQGFGREGERTDDAGFAGGFWLNHGSHGGNALTAAETHDE